MGTFDNLSTYNKILKILFKPIEIRQLDKEDLISSDEKIEKALRTISTLRSLAFQCTGIINSREYLYGLLFNMIFRAALLHRIDPQKSEGPLFLASVICHRLDCWDKPWPPSEWNS